MSTRLAVTFDYLCPFARNVNEHLIEGLNAGADWDVTFTPYSLSQGHVEEGEPDVWDAPDTSAVSGLLALQVGVAVRDHEPSKFLAVHRALFAARHDAGRDLKDRQVLTDVLETAGVEPAQIFELIDRGDILPIVRTEHDRNVAAGVWGVPTIIAGSRAVFVRVLTRPEGDGAEAQRQIDRIVDLITGVPALHEFKQVDLPA